MWIFNLGIATLKSIKKQHMDKYYTPSIEEFHVGFEFEVNYGKERWEKEAIYTKPQVVTLPYMNLKNIRVKYLDQEDIESLGFKHQIGKGIKSYTDKFIYKPNDNLQYELTYVYEQNILRIHVEDLVYFEESYNYLFQGTIKNKSELKRLLKQLGI